MASETSREKINVQEIHYDDGGVGLLVGDGDIYAGYDGEDVVSLLTAILSNGGDLWTITGMYQDGGDFITTEQICELFHVTPRTVYRWKEAGKIHGTKAGRRLLFNRKEVEALAE